MHRKVEVLRDRPAVRIWHLLAEAQSSRVLRIFDVDLDRKTRHLLSPRCRVNRRNILIIAAGRRLGRLSGMFVASRYGLSLVARASLLQARPRQDLFLHGESLSLVTESGRCLSRLLSQSSTLHKQSRGCLLRIISAGSCLF